MAVQIVLELDGKAPTTVCNTPVAPLDYRVERVSLIFRLILQERIQAEDSLRIKDGQPIIIIIYRGQIMQNRTKKIRKNVVNTYSVTRNRSCAFGAGLCTPGEEACQCAGSTRGKG